MRIHARNQPKWKLDVSRTDVNEAFFNVLKTHSEYFEEYTIDGTHMLPITNPIETGDLIEQFIQALDFNLFNLI